MHLSFFLSGVFRAATIHKSQGCTLSCAELILANTFTYGQAYVALSRVRDLRGLWLSAPIKRKSVMAHPDVLSFYKSIQSVKSESSSSSDASAINNVVVCESHVSSTSPIVAHSSSSHSELNKETSRRCLSTAAPGASTDDWNYGENKCMS